MEYAQRAFAGGEISGDLVMRNDQVKWAMGLAEARNFFVKKGGGVANRAGSDFIFTAKSTTAKLIPFVFSADQVYVLEAGDGYLRVFNPNDPFALPAHGAYNGATPYVVGDYVSYAGKVYRAIDASTGSQPDVSPADWYEQTDGVYEIEAPWTASDLADIGYVQANDVVTLTCNFRYPTDIKRYGEFNWVIGEAFGNNSWGNWWVAMAKVSASGGPAGSKTYKYRVSAVDPDNNHETLPMCIGPPLVAGVIPNTNFTHGALTRIILGPTAGVVNETVTVAALNKLGNDTVTSWPAYVFNREYKVVAIGTSGADKWIDINLDSSSFGPLTTKNADTVFTVYRTTLVVTGKDTPTEANPIVLSWVTPSLDGTTIGAMNESNAKYVTRPREYYVYREQDGAYGFIGIAGDSYEFRDKNYSPVMSDRAPYFSDPFKSEFPRVVSYFQQRRIFANSLRRPSAVWCSRTSAFDDFTTSTPIQSDDPIPFQLAGRTVNEVRHILDIGSLIVMTSSGEWVSKADALTPTTIQMKQESYNGSSWVTPVVIDNSAIYITNNGASVRDLRYELQSDGFSGKDLTVYATHLFEGLSIVSMAYARQPHSLVYCVRNDGKMAVMSYLREHEIWGWSLYDTNGLYKEIITVPFQGTDTPFVLVVRNGVAMVEQMLPRALSDGNGTDRFLDSGVHFIAPPVGTMTISQYGGSWTNEQVTVTIPSGVVVGDIGRVIHVSAADGSDLYLTASTYVDVNTLLCTYDRPIPDDLKSPVSIETASWCLQSVARPSHLVGPVGVVADGAAYNESSELVDITMPYPALTAYIGLSYVSRIKTLPIDSPQENILTKKKKLTSCGIRVRESRGFRVGTEDGKLREIREDGVADWQQNPPLMTGIVTVSFPGTFQDDAQVIVEGVLPMPLEILALIPKFDVGK